MDLCVRILTVLCKKEGQFDFCLLILLWDPLDSFTADLLLRSSITQAYTMLEASLVAQMVKNPPAIQETQVWCLGWEDPLEKGRATHPSILAWRILWTEELGGLESMGLQRVRYDWVTNTCSFGASMYFLLSLVVRRVPVTEFQLKSMGGNQNHS